MQPIGLRILNSTAPICRGTLFSRGTFPGATNIAKQDWLARHSLPRRLLEWTQRVHSRQRPFCFGFSCDLQENLLADDVKICSETYQPEEL